MYLPQRLFKNYSSPNICI
jgi:BASS family bile acid:Na+ symporter